MSDEQTQSQDQTTDQQQQQQQQQQTEEKVELSVQDYTRILDYIDELEAVRDQGPKGKPKAEDGDEEGDEIDHLARTAQKGKTNQTVNIDDMTPSQLATALRQEFGQGLTEIKTMLHAFKIEKDIERLTSDGKHDDFFDYQDDIYKLMVENPKLSIKRAYTIARNENPEKAKNSKEKGENDGQRRSAVMRGLPDPRRTFGERPGAASSSTGPGRAKTHEEAAEKAFDEIFKGKTPKE